MRRASADRKHHRISVIGGADAIPSELRMAEEVGKLVAQRGAILVTGGLGGVMEAASKGAAEAGGTVVGILPGCSADSANSHVGIPIVTGLGDARNVIVVSSADGIVAIGGSFGTLSEIAFAMKHGIPTVGLGTWRLDEERSGGCSFIPAETAAEAVETLFKAIATKAR
jgi:uncharacterized protein (TIGR00725 family)